MKCGGSLMTMLIPIFLSSLILMGEFGDRSYVTADETLITSTCSQTPYEDLCVSALKSDRRSASADTAGLARILVDKFSAKTKLAIRVVNQRVKTAKDPRVVRALRQCGEVYKAVMVADVPMAIEALTKGDPKFASTVDLC
uniref:Pectinesterase inhibitor domain-containing protein n=1 Tax=Kalanchoe fedtschenkoi TaxID=63787 RepID=A0A7N0ZXZ8_KALFE